MHISPSLLVDILEVPRGIRLSPGCIAAQHWRCRDMEGCRLRTSCTLLPEPTLLAGKSKASDMQDPRWSAPGSADTACRSWSKL